MTFTIAVILDTRRMKSNNLFSVRLQVIYRRKPQLYTTTFSLSEEDFGKLRGKNINEHLRKIRTTLNQIELDAKNFALSLVDFNHVEFEKGFIEGNPLFIVRKTKAKEKTEQVSEQTEAERELAKIYAKFKILKEEHLGSKHLSVTFAKYVKNLIDQGRIGNALNFQDAYFSLKKFRGNVPFSEITVGYLYQYERYMTEKKKRSISTVGIKLRALRAVYNEAIEDGVARRESYPFGRRRYLIPGSRRLKKALHIKEVKELYESEPDHEPDNVAKAYWFFCYFGNGMNPKDMAYLRYKNIDGDYLRFKRAKTKNTSRGSDMDIVAYINEDMRTVIRLYGNKDRFPNNFIFPILNDEMNVYEQHMRVKRLVKYMADAISRIAQGSGVKKKVNNSVCRHSFANVLKRSGTETEVIQELLGHASITTTEIYTEDFEDETKKEVSKRLKAF